MKVCGNMHLISRVYTVVGYVLDRLSDMRCWGSGGYNRQAGGQMETRKINNRKDFFFFTRKFQPKFSYIYLRIGDLWVSRSSLSDSVFLGAMYNVSVFYLSFPFTNEQERGNVILRL